MFSLVELANHFKIDDEDIKSDKLLFEVSKQAFVICALSVPWMAKYGYTPSAYAAGISAIAFGFCCRLVMRKKRSLSARWLFYVVAISLVTINSLTIGSEAMIWLYFLPLLCTVGLFLAPYGRRVFWGALSMIAGTFVVLIAAHFVFRWEPLQGVPSPEFVQSYRLMSIAGAATILMSLVFLNRRHEEAFRSRLLRQTELLIQSEKLSSLGIMSAGIAHEINNPLTAMTLQLDILQERYRNLNGFDG